MEAILQSRVSALIAIILISAVVALGQSAETENPFNKYMSPEGGVNPMSGTVALSKSLASISAGNLSVSFDLQYSGNVFKEIQNKNSLAPSGLVGLGWSFGRAKIIADDNGSMLLDDDSYYFLSSSGNRMKIVFGSDRFWIEGLPYWKIERLTKKVFWNEKPYEIIVGWKIIDDQGNLYWYGDYDDEPKKPKRNATEHSLAWPNTYGHVGQLFGVDDALYPNAWNLSKQENIDGDYLIYEYEQIFEGLKKGSFKTNNFYTKENYLKNVTSSDGSSIHFIYKNKGDGAFFGEYWDTKGKMESIGSLEYDAFIDPLERKFLSQIKFYDSDALKSQVDFSYKSFSIKPHGKTIDGYTKRLLTSVVFSKANEKSEGKMEEVDRENYDYYLDQSKQTDKNYPLGTLFSIHSSSCGYIEYQYTFKSTSEKPKSSINIQTLPIRKATLGYLEDGTPYVVGLGKDQTNFTRIYAYVLVSGVWKDVIKYGAEGHEEGSFIMGENGFFVYKSNEEENNSIYGDKGYSLTPFVWDGESFVRASEPIYDSGSNNVLAVSPSGYIVHGKEDGVYLNISIPWTRWGKTYTFYQIDVNHKAGRSGSGYSDFLQIIPNRNHLAIYFTEEEDLIDNGVLVIYTFDYSTNSLKETYRTEGIQEDNKYAWGSDYLFELRENQLLPGLFGAENKLKVMHWDNSGWMDSLTLSLNGRQGSNTIQASGNNYFALRHNDKDDLSLIDYDGENWNVPFHNMNMVNGDDFDVFGDEAYWSGHSGSDFFIALRPKTETTRFKFCTKIGFKKWGLKCKGYSEIDLYKSSKENVYIQLFKKEEDGSWNQNNPIKLGNDNKKNVIVGNNWYAETVNELMSVWDGFRWNMEQIDNSQMDASLKNASLKDAESLGGSFIKKQRKGLDGSDLHSTYIYYKQDDSFSKPIGSFFVTEKKVFDPITDRMFSYVYDFEVTNIKSKVGYTDNESYVYDSPLVRSVSIQLPENGGVIRKTLCIDHLNTKHMNLGLGQICNDEYFNSQGGLEKQELIQLERYRDSSWPAFVYQDRVASKTTLFKGQKETTKNFYLSEINGLPSIIRTSRGNDIKEQNIIYAAKIYDDMKEANRLTEVAGSYVCNQPLCTNGYILNASATRFSPIENQGKMVAKIKDMWAFQPKELTDRYKEFDFSWNSTISDNWVKIAENSQFSLGKPVESIDRLGNKHSSVYENKKGGMLIASVENAGIEEFSVFPGESCSLEQWNLEKCEQIELDGNGMDGNGVDFGRFSKYAIRLSPSKNIGATLLNSKGGKYRFSVWVQNKDALDTELSLKINGSSVKTWNISRTKMGQWHQLEWEGLLMNGRVEWELSLSSGEVRAQNLLFLPYNAVASVTYWDKKWVSPVVQVGSKGVGFYTKYDGLGRIIETYKEDAEGNIVLNTRKTYVQSQCHEVSSLTELKINGSKISLAQNGQDVYFTLPDNTNDIVVEWKLTPNNGKIHYQFYPEGTTNPDWSNPSCCSENENLGESSSWILKVQDFSVQSPIYTVNIKKNTSGWVSYGKTIEKGSKPSFVSSLDSSQLLFLSASRNKALTIARFDGNNWNTISLGEESVKDYISVVRDKLHYLLKLPFDTFVNSLDNKNPHVYSVNTSTTSDLGAVSEAEKSSLHRLALDKNNVPYLIYQSNINDDFGALVSRRYDMNENKWEDVGSIPVFGEANVEPVYKNGYVSDLSVSDADMILGPDGNLYVVYIGVTQDNRNFFEIENQESMNFGLPKLVVVKRLYDAVESKVNRNIWAGPSLFQEVDGYDLFPNFTGDILTINNDVVVNARRVKFAADESHLYLAVSYLPDNNPENNEALMILKGSYVEGIDENGFREKKLIFTPLYDNSIKTTLYSSSLDAEKRHLLYIKNNESFDFVVKNGVPYVSFINESNNNCLSVIHYKNGRWLSVGNPGFASAFKSGDEHSLSIGTHETPVVAFRESNQSSNANRRNQITAMKYSAQDDVDLTLSSIDFSDEITIENEFRQYLLNYNAKVSSSVNSISFTPIPQKINDLIGLQIENNGSIVASWIMNSSSTEMKKFLPDVKIDYSGAIPPTIPISLVEGLNEIRVKIIGKNGNLLYYKFIVEKDYKSVSNTVLSSLSQLLLVSSEIIKTPEEGSKKTKHIYRSYGSILKRNICISFGPGWRLTIGDRTLYIGGCFDFDPTNDFPQEIILTDGNGNEEIIIIEDGEVKPDQIDQSSSSGEDSDEDDPPGSEDDPLISIPPVYNVLRNYNLAASKNIALADRVHVEGNIIGNNIEIGANASVSGNISSSGNVLLRSQASVKNISLSGSLETQMGAFYSEVIKTSIDLPTISSISFTPGNGDVTVANNQSLSISPGYYNNLHAFSNSSLTFTPGDYYFNSFIIEPDVKLNFENEANGVRIWIQGRLSLADRVTLNNQGNKDQLFIYSNTNENIYIGVSTSLEGIFVLPYGTVNLAPRSSFIGNIWAETINIQADASVR